MQINVAELSWNDVKKYIYTTNGSLPDIYVLDTTRDDWSQWVAFVNDTCQVVFRDANEVEHEKIDIAAVLQCWDNNQADGWPFARILIGEVQINCFFRDENEIDGDIDPRQFKQLEDHLQLMQYLTSISKLLGKQIVMIEEGTRLDANNRYDPEPILIVDHDTIVTNAHLPSTLL